MRVLGRDQGQRPSREGYKTTLYKTLGRALRRGLTWRTAELHF